MILTYYSIATIQSVINNNLQTFRFLLIFLFVLLYCDYTHPYQNGSHDNDTIYYYACFIFLSTSIRSPPWDYFHYDGTHNNYEHPRDCLEISRLPERGRGLRKRQRKSAPNSGITLYGN